MLRGPLLLVHEALRVVQIGFGTAEEWQELLNIFCSRVAWAF